jgi:hypothetical protein
LLFRWLYPRKIVNLSESDGRGINHPLNSLKEGEKLAAEVEAQIDTSWISAKFGSKSLLLLIELSEVRWQRTAKVQSPHRPVDGAT